MSDGACARPRSAYFRNRMEHPPRNDAFTVAEAQQAIAETIVTELELGMTFLDVAETTRVRRHAWQSIRNAITALRSANRFLSEIEPGTGIDAVQQRREQLTARILAIIDVDDLGSSR